MCVYVTTPTKPHPPIALIMAFKLLGDRFAEQKLARKRRVAHLLVDNIPDDEAIKMRDGRYACLVCKHRPVFDTVSMLSVHRSGQKHLRATHARLHQQELRRQEMERTEQEAVSGPHQDECSPTLPPLLAQTKTLTTSLLSSQATPFIDGASLENGKIESGCGPEEPGGGHGKEDDDKQPFFVRKKPACSGTGARGTKKTSGGGGKQEQDIQYVFPWRTAGKKRKKVAPTATVSGGEELSQDEIAAVNYKKLRSAGWLLDKDGHWFKDSEVEFDSDEEVPRPLHS